MRPPIYGGQRELKGRRHPGRHPSRECRDDSTKPRSRRGGQFDRPALQAGGRRFDPGKLHLERPWKQGLFCFLGREGWSSKDEASLESSRKGAQG
jgi:hypothetical protein